LTIKRIAQPCPPARAKRFKLPDFAARRQRVFGSRVLPGNTVAEEREGYRW